MKDATPARFSSTSLMKSKQSGLSVGATFRKQVNLPNIKVRVLLWTVWRENKSTFSISASDDFGSLNLYLDKKTGRIKR